MGLSERFWKWLGIEQETVREEQVEWPVAKPVEGTKGTGAPNNLVSIHSSKPMKVVVFEPEKFDEVQVLADHLKSRQEIILNMENTSPDVSQRIIDFIAGATYSLEGHTEQIGKHVFVFTPSNIEISKDSRSAAVRRNPFYAPGGGDR